MTDGTWPPETQESLAFYLRYAGLDVKTDEGKIVVRQPSSQNHRILRCKDLRGLVCPMAWILYMLISTIHDGRLAIALRELDLHTGDHD